ncbi:MAG: hypothetical protein ACRD1B_00115 [Thermoanaerobaculia bacterium]
MKVEVVMKNVIRIAAFACCAGLLACSSSGSGASSGKPDKVAKVDKGGGFRVLEAVVVEREIQTGFGGSQTFYLGFEAKDGEATAHMRYPVTREQYYRYTEGTHVRLYMADDRLREIRSDSEK